jgi:hypothetical protein
MLHGVLAVTEQLSITYVKPVPIGRPLVTCAWATEKTATKWMVSGELCLESTGALLGRADAVMVLRDHGHFDRHRKWLAEQDQLQ